MLGRPVWTLFRGNIIGNYNKCNKHSIHSKHFITVIEINIAMITVDAVIEVGVVTDITIIIVGLTLH